MKKIGIILGILGFITVATAAVETRFQNNVVMSQNATVGGTLGVTGNTSVSTLSSSGAVSPNSLAVTNNATVGGTLGVTGNSSLSTLSTSGAATLNSLGVTNNATVGGTLGVTGNAGFTTFSSSGLGSPNSLSVASTLSVSGNSSFSTLSSSGLATLSSLSVTNTGTLNTLVVNTTATTNDLIVNQNGTVTVDLDVGNSALMGTLGTANSNSVLELVSTTKGFLPPRMTTTQRNAISSPTNGLSLFNTTTNRWNYWNSAQSAYQPITPGEGTAGQVAIYDADADLTSEAFLNQTRGGTGVSNGGTLSYGSDNVTFTTSGTTTLTLPTTGIVATRAGVETFNNKTLATTTVFFGDTTDNSKKLGFDLSGATTNKTMTISSSHTDNRSWVIPDTSNTFLGESNTATVSNKTLNNSNVATLRDSNLSVVNNSDVTKIAKFSSSNLSTGTTRTFFFPDVDGDTFTLNSAAQTLTSKSIDADANTITNLENADIKSGANIARNKLASGSANHVVVNDGSGVMSSEAFLHQTRGGTGVSNGGNFTYGSDNLTFTTGGATTLTLPTTGTLATLAGTENFSNKTFLSTTSKFGDTADPTKKLGFSLSGATTAKTMTVSSSHTDDRTWIIPDTSNTFLGESNTATVTNKSIDADANTLTNIDNADIKAGANIARTKLASGSANHVIINDGSGVLSSEAQLAQTRGGTGVSNGGTLSYGNDNVTFVTSGTTSVTLPTTGTLATRAGSEVFSNKTLATTTVFFGDTTDNTKKAGFDLSGATTAKTLTLISLHSDNRSWTFPDSTDTFAGTATAQTFTNKSIDADTNTITNIENADIKSGAAIARNKLASGSANHVIINDGSGVMSSEAALGPTRGGTGLTSYATGQLIYANATNTLTQLSVGSTGQILQSVGGVPAWGQTITSWASYSSVNSSWGNSVVTYASYWRRVADSGDFRIGLRLSNTVSGTLNFSQSQFFGSLSLNVNTSKLPTQTDNRIAIGKWVGYNNGANIYGGEVMFNVEGGANDIYLTNNNNNTLSSTTPFTWDNTDSLTIDVSGLPITEWN